MSSGIIVFKDYIKHNTLLDNISNLPSIFANAKNKKLLNKGNNEHFTMYNTNYTYLYIISCLLLIIVAKKYIL